MKKIIFLLLLIFEFTVVYSQEKSFYGTFLIGQEVVNYKYTSHPNNLYTLKFFKLADSTDKFQSKLTKEDLDKVLNMIVLINDRFIPNNNEFLIELDQNVLKEKIEEVTSIIEEIEKIPDLNKTIFENSKIIFKKFEEIDLDTFFTGDALAVKEAKEKLTEFKKFFLKLSEIIDEPQSKESEKSLYDIKIENYKVVIKSLISELIGPDKLEVYDGLDELSTRLFYELKTRMEFIDYQPITANVLLVNKNIKVKNDDNLELNVEIEKVEIEFASGGIKNIIVYSKETNSVESLNRIKFHNVKPISISGKYDPGKLSLHSLIADKSSIPDHYKYPTIKMADFLRYDITLANNNEDYSPADTIITLSKTVPIGQVYKSKTSKIISARTFTDLIGIDGQQPNGLIQLEVFKRLNLITDYNQKFFFWYSRTNYQGFLSYIEPKFLVTKIEENNRYLPLSRDNSQDLSNPNSLDVYRYQQFAFGVDLNLYNLNIQNYKSKFFLDLHYNIARTTAQDGSDPNSQSLIRLNVRNWGPKFYYQILPDSRFGFKMGYDAIKQIIQSDVVTIEDPGKNWLGTAWFLGNLKTNQNGSEMFFRLRFNHLLKDVNTNFLEVQLGYAFDILKSN